MQPRLLLIALALVTAACSAGSPNGEGTLPDLPLATAASLADDLAADPRPAVVNVWASWCGPCRAEAPLLSAAAVEYGDRVAFVGVNVQDAQGPAKAFIAEYALDFHHVFDPRGAVPAAFGGFGVPITYFVAADGTVTTIHSGIIDERGLVAGIDELLAGG